MMLHLLYILYIIECYNAGELGAFIGQPLAALLHHASMLQKKSVHLTAYPQV